MTRLLLLCATAGISVALVSCVGKTPDRPPQQIVDERVSVMKSFVGVLVQTGKFLKGEGPAADALAKVSAARAAAGRIPSMFPAGTAPGDAGVVSSRALPPVWSNAGDFSAKAKALETAFATLETALTANNVDQTKAGIDTTKKACLACHDTYRGPEPKT